MGKRPLPIGLVGADESALGALVIVSDHETRHAIHHFNS